MKRHALLLIATLTTATLFASVNDSLQLHYTFQSANGSTITDVSGHGYNGSLKNGATVSTLQSHGMLNLGTANGYLDLGVSTGELINSLNDFTIATYLYLDPAQTISGNGYFVWAFSTREACSQTSGRYIAYRVNQQRYAQSSGGWGNEVVAVSLNKTAEQGRWHHVVLSQSGSSVTLYMDGVAVKSSNASLKPSDIGSATSFNWLGRAPFNGDAYLKGASYSDFRVYNRALSTSELSTFTPTLNALNYAYDSLAVEAAKATLTLSGLDSLRYNLSLPTTTGNNIALTWSSSNQTVLSNSGIVTRPAANQSAVSLTLTATLSSGQYQTTKSFAVTVLPALDDAVAVAKDLANLELNTTRRYYLGRMDLLTQGLEGSQLSWVSEAPSYLTNTGEIIKLPGQAEGIKTVKITVTATKGGATANKEFLIQINPDEGYSAYLFVYFTGNAAYTQENIFYALSEDGYNYKTLNGGNYIVKADTISDMNGVRDPHILRGHDGQYYMVVTDMRSSLGWTSNHGIVLMKSPDLIHWQHSAIDIKALYPAFSTIDRAWAPQTYYDEQAGKYMVYFSMKTWESGSYDRIYYAYANADFTALESAPQILFDNGNSTIDGDIVYRDGTYHLFFKTEDAADKGYKKAVSNRLTGGYTLVDRYLDQTNDAVEGACVFKLNNRDTYILMYDVYTSGRYEFTQSNDLETFSLVSSGVSMDFTPRHGTVIGITPAEARRLADQWGDSDLVSLPQQPSIPATEALGNLVSSTLYTLSGKQLSLSNHLPAGFYLLRKLYASGAVVTEKILVQTAK